MSDFEKELEREIKVELLDNLTTLLENLSDNRGIWFTPEQLEVNLRSMHSAKGNANAGGFSQYSGVLHGLEDIFFSIRDQGVSISSDTEDLICDFVADLVKFVDQEVRNDVIPLEVNELTGRLEKIYFNAFNEEEVEVPTPFLVLLVDDNLEFLEVFHESLALEFPDWQFRKAENGKIALDIAQNQKFDLILTDYFMPEMNGNDFIKGVRSDSQNVDTSIVMVTAFKPEFDNDQALWEGVFFLEKPINWKRLKFIVNCMSKNNIAS